MHILPALSVLSAWVCLSAGEPCEPIHDRLWVWGNPEMATPGPHSLDNFAQASPLQRARLLGVPNVIMAGLGLPHNDAEAEALMERVAGVPRIVWEISPDVVAEGAAFVYDDTISRLKRLAERYPQIEGVLLDDMSTVAIDRGFKPEHIRRVRELLAEKHEHIKVWGVVYTMSLDRPGIADYVQELDVINLWTWHAKDTPDIEKNVARCEGLFPEKPITLGLYLHDYGDGRPIPRELLESQCATALELLKAHRIKDIVFLTIDNDRDALAWTADWIRQVASEDRIPVESPLRLGDGAGWAYSGEPWTEDAEGVIRPPDKRNLHSRAFHISQAFSDIAVEFEFNGSYRETGTGSAGLVLRATDTNHGYLIYFPWGGQQLRAKHFWAAAAKLDGDAYLRHLRFEWVPGVPSETDRWYKVRVEAKGPSIQVWVDGRAALEVHDESYRSGCLGLAGYGWYAFRNLRVTGNGTPPAPWNPAPIPVHAFTLDMDSRTMPSGCVAPNGDILLAQANRLVRSRDKGRTWGPTEPLPDKLGPISDYGSTMFCDGGRLLVMVYRTQEQAQKPIPEILMAESADNGATWSDPVPAEVAPNWPALPKNLVPYGPLVRTSDGMWLRFLLGSVKQEGDAFTDVRTWGAVRAKAFVIRSADAGGNWSAPVDLDAPSWADAARGTIPGSLDLTEPTGIAIGNKVMVLVRPIYSPMMWQCWSHNGGATWDAAARATFPGYAQSMVRTSSGVILCAHRYPHYSVHLSRDGGLNWDAGAVVDYPVWAMGCAIEVEPDVVLLTYMNADQSMPLLAQLVKVTAHGIVPVAGDGTERPTKPAPDTT